MKNIPPWGLGEGKIYFYKVPVGGDMLRSQEGILICQEYTFT